MTNPSATSLDGTPLVSFPVHPVHPANEPRQAPSFSERTQQRSLASLLTLLSLAGLFAFWYVGTKYRIELYIRFKNVPTPREVWLQAREVVGSTAFFVHIVHSLRRILAGFAFATCLGLGLGLLIGKYRHASQLFMPALEVLRPIPAIAWVPISIMLWPNNEASIVFITFLGAFFPILLNTVHGVHAVDRVLLNAGRCLGASELQLFVHILLPAVMPSVFTGLTVGMGVSWVSLIAAEMISGQFGVGYYTWEAYSLVNYPGIVLGMLTIGLLGLCCSGAIRAAGRLSMPWLAYVNGGRK
jgi:NitT/TauT family transport system permease protein